jgi:hypothetical protein
MPAKTLAFIVVLVLCATATAHAQDEQDISATPPTMQDQSSGSVSDPFSVVTSNGTWTNQAGSPTPTVNLLPFNLFDTYGYFYDPIFNPEAPNLWLPDNLPSAGGAGVLGAVSYVVDPPSLSCDYAGCPRVVNPAGDVIDPGAEGSPTYCPTCEPYQEPGSGGILLNVPADQGTVQDFDPNDLALANPLEYSNSPGNFIAPPPQQIAIFLPNLNTPGGSIAKISGNQALEIFPNDCGAGYIVNPAYIMSGNLPPNITLDPVYQSFLGLASWNSLQRNGPFPYCVPNTRSSAPYCLNGNVLIGLNFTSGYDLPYCVLKSPASAAVVVSPSVSGPSASNSAPPNCPAALPPGKVPPGCVANSGLSQSTNSNKLSLRSQKSTVARTVPAPTAVKVPIAPAKAALSASFSQPALAQRTLLSTSITPRTNQPVSKSGAAPRLTAAPLKMNSSPVPIHHQTRNATTMFSTPPPMTVPMPASTYSKSILNSQRAPVSTMQRTLRAEPVAPSLPSISVRNNLVVSSPALPAPVLSAIPMQLHPIILQQNTTVKPVLVLPVPAQTTGFAAPTFQPLPTFKPKPTFVRNAPVILPKR